MPPFKDEHILIIAPGSQTTLAQLGLPESFTPPQRRFPTRMFLAPDGKTYEPYKIRPKKKDASATTNGDTEMGGIKEDKADEEEELEEVPEDDEGAIWPLKGLSIGFLQALYILIQCRGSNRESSSLLRFPTSRSQPIIANSSHACYVNRTTCLDGQES